MKICLLGSTGSVGSSFIEVIRMNGEHSITSLAAGSNISKLLEQAQEFSPNKLVVAEQAGADKLSARMNTANECELLVGEEGIQQAITEDGSDCVVNALSGTKGIIASILTLKAGKRLLLANKESLVAGGKMLNDLAKKHKSEIIPLDSEHNAVIRCLPKDYKLGDNIHKYGVKKIWLTASGGPFLNKSKDEMDKATIAAACKHPIWPMGNKISIDSATMMNKGLEIIEACHLFSIEQQDVEVIVHPQSIVHCLVEYNDGSFIAQLSKPDMQITIHQALNYPKYTSLDLEPLNPLEMGSLDFSTPDADKFPCLGLARTAQDAGGIMPMVMSIADDYAVDAFMANKISFGDINKLIATVMDKHKERANMELTDDIQQIKDITQQIGSECEAALNNLTK